MAYVIVKPTVVLEPILPNTPTPQEQAAYDAALLVYQQYLADVATYEAQIDGVRHLASPDLIIRFTAEDLPESLIADDVYLLAAEREVLREAAIAVSDIAGLSANDAAVLVLLVQLKLTIELIPQLPQLLQEGILGETQRLAEIDWTARLVQLLSKYRNDLLAINPAADVVDDSQIVVAGNTTDSHEIDFEQTYFDTRRY